ncbi:MAG: hypothetical protein JWN04_2735 [Myxococcaceae bacterium]|nr:hypothetical protein [Myxococcaceae bacterium]
MKVAVTGADGFIGQRACEQLASHGHEVRRLVRGKNGLGSDRYIVGTAAGAEAQFEAMQGVDCVVHLAGRAHVLEKVDAAAELAFQQVNVHLTRELAEHAIRAGVRRFVFVSSIGVNGPSTSGRPFSEADPARPTDAYAKSKLAAERELLALAGERALELVIVRPPLVYGPGAKGNLLRMVKLAASGVPLPLALVKNRRNLVGLDNLCAALVLCAEHPAAAGETFLVAEPEVRSTPEILSALYSGLGRPSRLFPMPIFVLRAGARLVGRGTEFHKMCSSLEVDSSKAMHLLGWRPRPSFSHDMESVARSYLERST